MGIVLGLQACVPGFNSRSRSNINFKNKKKQSNSNCSNCTKLEHDTVTSVVLHKLRGYILCKDVKPVMSKFSFHIPICITTFY